MRQSLLMLFLFAFPVGAFAGVDSFECKVSVAYVVDPENGTLVTDTTHLKEQIGATFSVNRKSGEIRPIRGSIFLTNASAKHVSVIDSAPIPGADYFVVSVSWGPKISVGYLYIETFRAKPGRQPFTFTTGGGYFYAGLCS
jgi:hypothetical protein